MRQKGFGSVENIALLCYNFGETNLRANLEEKL
jgi:hypothetical protein